MKKKTDLHVKFSMQRNLVLNSGKKSEYQKMVNRQFATCCLPSASGVVNVNGLSCHMLRECDVVGSKKLLVIFLWGI